MVAELSNPLPVTTGIYRAGEAMCNEPVPLSRGNKYCNINNLIADIIEYGYCKNDCISI